MLLTSEFFVWKSSLKCLDCGFSCELARVGTNAHDGATRQERFGLGKNSANHFHVVLSVLELAFAFVSGTARLTWTAKQPQSQPLVVIIICDAVIRGRCE